ncbi:MAG TPA: sulfotransferase [Sphingomicrobium sp.]|nr:sulfotransferase [Sphingomicrobium sp.]
MTSASGEPLVQTRGGSYEDGLLNGHRLLAEHPAVALQQAETLLRSGAEPRAFELAAAALRRLGRTDEAEKAELSGISASFAIRQLDAAAVANVEGRGAESRAMVEQFLSARPTSLLALTMAAEMDIEDWKLTRAEERLRSVLERAPSFLRAIMLLAKCLSNEAKLQEAIDVVEGVVKRKPNNPIALRNLAQALGEANQHDKAAEIYARLLELNPEQLDILIIYAQELRMLGRKEESKAAFRRALALDPNSGAAWWGLANYFASDLGELDVEAMERALATSGENAPEAAPLSISLGLMAERRGDHASAFRHISEGKRLLVEAHPYDSAAASEKIDEIIATFSPDLFAKRKSEGLSNNSPIFIVGMPRSGTTLLERILSRHSQIEAGGELPILPRLEEWLRNEGEGSYAERIASLEPDEIRRIGERYVSSTRDYRSSDKPRIIDKLNYNWTRTGLIRLVLPDAKIIDLRRNALDCCWSNFKMMFAEGHVAANDQRAIAQFYRDYVRMIETIDTASPGGILKVRYEELVDDVEGEARRILDFLGLEWEPACVDFHLATEAVATPSSEQVRRPINRDSIGSAEPYRQWLGPMIEALGDLAH